MTRPDLNGEPSMEEILASIRKIIAEDPPGSRPVPEVPRESLRRPAVAPSEARDPFAALTAKPSSQPETEKTDPFGLGQQKAQPRFEVETRPNDLTMPKRSTDIEDQMAEILGARQVSEPKKSELKIEVPSRHEPVAQATVQAAIDSLIGAPRTRQSAGEKPEAPRDFINPIAARMSQGQTTYAAAGRDSDPFEFALGPSPFARSANPPEISEPAPAATRSSIDDLADLGAVVPGRHLSGDLHPIIETKASPQFDEVVRVAEHEKPAAERAGDEAGATLEIGSPSISARLEAVAPAGASLEASSSSTAAPSVAERSALREEPSVAAEASEPARSKIFDTIDAAKVDIVKPFVEAQTSVTKQEAVERNVEKSQEPVVAALESPPVTTYRVEAGDRRDNEQMEVVEHADAGRANRTLTPARISQEPVALPAQRTMEDTVAELLRPMLKSWLAENMPKIVERALRKELDETLQSGHKTAAE